MRTVTKIPCRSDIKCGYEDPDSITISPLDQDHDPDGPPQVWIEAVGTHLVDDRSTFIRASIPDILIALRVAVGDDEFLRAVALARG